MKYRLKDRELQKKLDEATDGEFSRRLQNDRERMDGMILIGCMGMIEDRRRHNHTKLQRMTLCFATDEIEEVAEYDPHAWNKYPEVERRKTSGCGVRTFTAASQNVSNVSPRGTHLNMRTASGSTRGSATDSVVMLPASARGTRGTRNDKGIRETQQRNV